MHFNKGMQVVKSNSVGSVRLFVLEYLIYTSISFWQNTSSCSSLHFWFLFHVTFWGRSRFSKLMLLPSCWVISFTHLLTPSEREKGLNMKAAVTCKGPATLIQNLRNYLDAPWFNQG